MKRVIRSSVEVTRSLKDAFIRRLISELGYSRHYAKQVADNYIYKCNLFDDEDINNVDDAIEYVRLIDSLKPEDIQKIADDLAREGYMF